MAQKAPQNLFQPWQCVLLWHKIIPALFSPINLDTATDWKNIGDQKTLLILAEKSARWLILCIDEVIAGYRNAV